MSDQEKQYPEFQAHIFADGTGAQTPCACPHGRDHGPLRVAELRLHGFGKTEQAEADRASWHAQEALDAFAGNAYRVYVQQTEEQLKEVLRAALKLVEENPRNEPMRAEIGRPAVERMLAEDIRSVQEISVLLSSAEQGRLVTALFDLGWRPTIDRLVR